VQPHWNRKYFQFNNAYDCRNHIFFVWTFWKCTIPGYSIQGATRERVIHVHIFNYITEKLISEFYIVLWNTQFRTTNIEEKPGLWRSNQCLPRSAFSIYLYLWIVSKWYRKRGNPFLQNVWHLIRACSFCPSISQGFQNDNSSTCFLCKTTELKMKQASICWFTHFHSWQSMF